MKFSRAFFYPRQKMKKVLRRILLPGKSMKFSRGSSSVLFLEYVRGLL